MHDLDSRGLGDLPTTGLGITDSHTLVVILHVPEHTCTDLLGDLVALGLQTVCTSDATARLIGLQHFDARDEFHELNRREPHALALDLAGLVVRDCDVDRTELRGVEFAVAVLVHEELRKVPGAHRNVVQTRVVNTHNLVGLVLHHSDAGAGRGHDCQALPEADDLVAQAEDVFGSALEQSVRLLSQTTATLLRHEHLVAQMLKYLDGLLGGFGLEVAAGAALEEDDRPLGGRLGRLVVAHPLAQSLGLGGWHWRIAVDLNDLLDGDANRLLLEAPVGQWGDRGQHASLKGGQRDEAVTQRHTILVLHLGSRLLVELRNLHALWAVESTDAAEVTPLEGVVDGSSVAVALTLWAVVLRSGVERGGLGHRAHRLTDSALDAGVERLARDLVSGERLLDNTNDQFLSLVAAPAPTDDRMASAALMAEPRATPSPDFSCHLVAPAMTPPAA